MSSFALWAVMPASPFRPPSGGRSRSSSWRSVPRPRRTPGSPQPRPAPLLPCPMICCIRSRPVRSPPAPPLPLPEHRLHHSQTGPPARRARVHRPAPAGRLVERLQRPPFDGHRDQARTVALRPGAVLAVRSRRPPGVQRLLFLVLLLGRRRTGAGVAPDARAAGSVTTTASVAHWTRTPSCARHHGTPGQAVKTMPLPCFGLTGLSCSGQSMTGGKKPSHSSLSGSKLSRTELTASRIALPASLSALSPFLAIARRQPATASLMAASATLRWYSRTLSWQNSSRITAFISRGSANAPGDKIVTWRQPSLFTGSPIALPLPGLQRRLGGADHAVERLGRDEPGVRPERRVTGHRLGDDLPGDRNPLAGLDVPQVDPADVRVVQVGPAHELVDRLVVDPADAGPSREVHDGRLLGAHRVRQWNRLTAGRFEVRLHLFPFRCPARRQYGRGTGHSPCTAEPKPFNSDAVPGEPGPAPCGSPGNARAARCASRRSTR